MQFEFANQESKDALLALVDKSVLLWKENGHDGYENLREAAELLRSAAPEQVIDVPSHLNHAIHSICGAWEEMQRSEALLQVLEHIMSEAERAGQSVH